MRLRHVKAGDMVAPAPVKVVNADRALKGYVSSDPGIITTLGEALSPATRAAMWGASLGGELLNQPRKIRRTDGMRP